MIWLDGSVGGKIVFTLLAKVIALYIRPITVDVWGFGLKFIFRSIFKGVEKCLDDFI